MNSQLSIVSISDTRMFGHNSPATQHIDSFIGKEVETLETAGSSNPMRRARIERITDLKAERSSAKLRSAVRQTIHGMDILSDPVSLADLAASDKPSSCDNHGETSLDVATGSR